MSKLDNLSINLKLLSKSIEREAKRCEKNEKAEKAKVKKAIRDNRMEQAQIFAENAIRNKNQQINYIRLASRLDAVSQRVKSAAAMNHMTKNIAGVSKALDRCLKQFDLEKIQNLMKHFEQQFEDLDVQSSTMDSAMNNTVTNLVPQDRVVSLLQECADEADLELSDQLRDVTTGSTLAESEAETTLRLKQLRDTHD